MNEGEARAYLCETLAQWIGESIGASDARASRRSALRAQIERSRTAWPERARQGVRREWVNEKSARAWDQITERAARALAERLKNEVEAELGGRRTIRHHLHWPVPIETYMNVWWSASGARERTERGWRRASEAARARRAKASGYLVGSLEDAGDAPETLWATLAKMPAWMHYDVVVRPELWEAGRTRCLGAVVWERRGWELAGGAPGPDDAFCEGVRAVLARWRWREREPPMSAVAAWALTGVVPRDDTQWAAAAAVPINDETMSGAREMTAAIEHARSGLHEAACAQVRAQAAQILAQARGLTAGEAHARIEAIGRVWPGGAGDDAAQWKLGSEGGMMVWTLPCTTPERALAAVEGAQDAGEDIARRAGAEATATAALRWPVRPSRARHGWAGKRRRRAPDAALGEAIRASIEAGLGERGAP